MQTILVPAFPSTRTACCATALLRHEVHDIPRTTSIRKHGSAPVRLGTRDQGSFLAGGLADVAIYPRVLTAGEILDNFRGA
jgi:hypothetical protein